ncbi:hypothetical protein BGZ76_009555 [Entomortierella beljakovae]|nr:hypothetical protein BGZ76_009555 [Entomortierella beljakovae]
MSTPRSLPEFIIVGAGSGGLMMGLLLERMGASYTILERAPKQKTVGTAFTVQGNILAAIDQLGFLEEILDIALPIGPVEIYDKKLQIKHSIDWKERKEVTGYGFYIYSRYRFHEVMVKKVPAHKVLMNKSVARYEETKDRVIVHCTDGSTYEGDILIAADGVHSGIRNQMYKQLSEKNLLPESDKKPDRIKFIMTVALFEPKDPSKYPKLKDPHCNYTVTHGGNYIHWLAFTLADNQMCWAIIKQIKNLETAKKADPMLVDRSPKAVEAMMNDFRNYPSPLGGTMGDMFDDTLRENISKVFIEENMRETWHHGRVVLTGDAIHKVNPVTGQGSMNAMQDAIILSNCIYDMNDTTTESISMAFESYKKQRYDNAKEIVEMGKALGGLAQGQTIWQRIYRCLYFKVVSYSAQCKDNEKIESYRPQVNWIPMIESKGTGLLQPQLTSKRYQKEQEMKDF